MYEIFEQLLKKHGVTRYQVYKATGVPQSSLSDWKNGKSKPKYEKLVKIAEYFNVSVDYLLGIETKKPSANAEDNIQCYDENDNRLPLSDDVIEILDTLRTRPEMKILFSVSKKATKEDIEKTVKIIEALRK